MTTREIVTRIRELFEIVDRLQAAVNLLLRFAIENNVITQEELDNAHKKENAEETGSAS